MFVPLDIFMSYSKKLFTQVMFLWRADSPITDTLHGELAIIIHQSGLKEMQMTCFAPVHDILIKSIFENHTFCIVIIIIMVIFGAISP